MVMSYRREGRRIVSIDDEPCNFIPFIGNYLLAQKVFRGTSASAIWAATGSSALAAKAPPDRRRNGAARPSPGGFYVLKVIDNIADRATISPHGGPPSLDRIDWRIAKNPDET